MCADIQARKLFVLLTDISYLLTPGKTTTAVLTLQGPEGARESLMDRALGSPLATFTMTAYGAHGGPMRTSSFVMLQRANSTTSG